MPLGLEGMEATGYKYDACLPVRLGWAVVDCMLVWFLSRKDNASDSFVKHFIWI